MSKVVDLCTIPVIWDFVAEIGGTISITKKDLMLTVKQYKLLEV